MTVIRNTARDATEGGGAASSTLPTSFDSSFDPARAVPPPSAVQRAYWTSPDQFLAALHARAEGLFAAGYRVRASRVPYVFVVEPPDPKRTGLNGSPGGYLVHAVKGTCSCPFFSKQERGEALTADGAPVPCKHLLGLEGLVRECAVHCRQAGDLYRHFRLRSQWLDVLAERHRARTEGPSGAAARKGGGPTSIVNVR